MLMIVYFWLSLITPLFLICTCSKLSGPICWLIKMEDISSPRCHRGGLSKALNTCKDGLFEIDCLVKWSQQKQKEAVLFWERDIIRWWDRWRQPVFIGAAAGQRRSALRRRLTARRAHNTINIQMLFLAHFSRRRGAGMDVTLLWNGNELRSHAARLSSGWRVSRGSRNHREELMRGFRGLLFPGRAARCKSHKQVMASHPQTLGGRAKHNLATGSLGRSSAAQIVGKQRHTWLAEIFIVNIHFPSGGCPIAKHPSKN